MLYFDAAYVAKCYLNEPDAEPVRALAESADLRCTSALSVAEVSSAIRRRRGPLAASQVKRLLAAFREQVSGGVWLLIPVSETLLWEVHEALARLPPKLPLRAGDAIHLIAARSAGCDAIWSSDRHLLGAAARFGLQGRSVGGG